MSHLDVGICPTVVKKTTSIGVAGESCDVVEFGLAVIHIDAYGRLFAMKEFIYGCRITNRAQTA